MSIKKTRNHKPGFTLIELLVVIAIIGLLATLSVVALNSSRARARDSRRISDIKQIQTALELYFHEHQEYPESLTFQPAHDVLEDTTTGIGEYMIPIPQAPTPADGDCEPEYNSYHYQSTDGQSYQIRYCLGSSTGTLESGLSFASPMHLQAATGGGESSFTCGDLFTDERDDNVYQTVKIGDQCWMAENLNVGTRIDGDSNQGTFCDENIEKYCYDDNESNCNIYGGLYQWNQAMCGSTTEEAQGICPDGWYLPSDDDFKDLEMELEMSESDANDSGWRGSPVGNKLKESTFGGNNSSGFTALPAGLRHSNGSFVNLGVRAYFWSSSEVGGNAWSRRLDSSNSSVSRDSFNQALGFSVRCLRTD